jgi:hypothetical protein
MNVSCCLLVGETGHALETSARLELANMRRVWMTARAVIAARLMQACAGEAHERLCFAFHSP